MPRYDRPGGGGQATALCLTPHASASPGGRPTPGARMADVSQGKQVLAAVTRNDVQKLAVRRCVRCMVVACATWEIGQGESEQHRCLS